MTPLAPGGRFPFPQRRTGCCFGIAAALVGGGGGGAALAELAAPAELDVASAELLPPTSACKNLAAALLGAGGAGKLPPPGRLMLPALSNYSFTCLRAGFVDLTFVA